MNLLNITDMDWQLIKCIGYLHSSESFSKDDAISLQLFLEESIRSKYGVSKDLTNLVSSCIKQECMDRVEEYKPVLNIYEDTKASNSDDELELDLFKEDLMCVVCNGMDVAARNQLLECSNCHALYHQDCHRPVVSLQDSFDSWVCSNCKELNKESNPSTSTSNNPTSSDAQSVPSMTSSNLKQTVSKISSHKHGGSDGYKSSSDKYSKGSSSGMSKSSTSSVAKSQNSSSNSRNVTPNINIISADKRIQNMKKKAAKLQEKRKLPKMC